MKKVSVEKLGKNIVLYYEGKGASPVLIKEKDIPKAICMASEDVIVTDILDREICSTFGCFLNRLNPQYAWIRRELIQLQMGGIEDKEIEYAPCDADVLYD